MFHRESFHREMLRQVVLALALCWAGTGVLTAHAAIAEEVAAPPERRMRVLITNDNGIEDPKIVALARAFSRQAETWVVAPARDQSGTGSYLSVVRLGEMAVERRELGEEIQAFAVDGFPADCVVLALAGLMAESPPDLIVSGINGGANLGSDWMFSGTVGAARVAAFAGFPAIAVSGLDDDLPGAVEATVDWVLRLATGAAVGALQPGEYLTVSFPRTAPEEIVGVRIVDRAPHQIAPRFAADDGGETWRLVGLSEIEARVPADSDLAATKAGYIAVVPMRVDEVDLKRLARWRRQGAGLPEWREKPE